MRNRHGLVCVMAALLAATALEGSEREQAKNLIVKLAGRLAGGDRFGAGIIFSISQDSVYIATADHVVRLGEKEGIKDLQIKDLREIKDLRVGFKFRPGETVSAKLLDHRSEKLDLAVLRVPLAATDLPSRLLPNPNVFCLAPRGDLDDVYPVGHPHQHFWKVPSRPVGVLRVRGDEIDFEYSCVMGDSGGALFDSQWRIAGLIVDIKFPTCTAISFERIRAELENWGYEVAFLDTEYCPSPCTEESSNWPEAYVDGFVALKRCLKQGWQVPGCGSQATDLLQRAACDAKLEIMKGKKKKIERPIKISALFTITPLPFYHLGLAFFHSGQLDKALTQWIESEGQGLIVANRRVHLALPLLIEIAEAATENFTMLEDLQKDVGEVLQRPYLKKKDWKRLSEIAGAIAPPEEDPQ